MIDLSKEAKQKDFAKVIGVSAAAVSGMVDAGIIQAGETLGQWILSYTSHLRERAAGRAGSGDLDLVAERAALARAQRDKIEMQNAVTRGELAPVMLIEQVLTKAAAKCAGVLDAIPGMVRRRVPKLESAEIDLIAGEVAKARNTIAALSLDDLLDEEVGATEARGQEEAVIDGSL